MGNMYHVPIALSSVTWWVSAFFVLASTYRVSAGSGTKPNPAARFLLRATGLAQKHNSTYRYSKLNGKTPLTALARLGTRLVFPDRERVPRHPLEKPGTGSYHLVRFVRSDCQLNIFGELCSAPPETQYEYVVATIDVREKKLKLSLGPTQVAEYDYQLR
jgi:hypothetical protein